MFLIERASVDALQQAWKDLVPLEILAQSYLGVTKGVALALEDAGMLLPMRGPNDDRYKQHLYNQTTIEQFEQAILAHTAKSHRMPVETMIPLTAFASKAGIPFVTLLKELFDGYLLPVEVNKDQPLFRRLVLPKAEVACFLEEYKRRQRKKRGLLTPGEISIDLGISERVLRRWVQWGLIEGEKLSIDGKKPSLLFQKHVLEDFRRIYAFTEEVAKLLDVVPHTVSKYVRSRLLHPVVGRNTRECGNRLVFRRDEVNALMYCKYENYTLN